MLLHLFPFLLLIFKFPPFLTKKGGNLHSASAHFIFFNLEEKYESMPKKLILR